MQKIILEEGFFNSLKNNKIIYDYNYIFKYSPDSKEILDLIMANISLIKRECVAEPQSYLEYDGYVGFVRNNYKSYNTLEYVLKYGTKFDKKITIYKIIDTIFSLERRGISLSEIDLKEILTNGIDIKLTNLDQATIVQDEENYILARKAMLELVIKTHLGIIDNPNLLLMFSEIEELKSIYTNELLEYIKLILSLDKSLAHIDIWPIIHQFDNIIKNRKAKDLILNYDIKKM